MLVNTELCKLATCKVRLLLVETINRGMPARLLGAFRPLEVWVVKLRHRGVPLETWTQVLAY